MHEGLIGPMASVAVCLVLAVFGGAWRLSFVISKNQAELVYTLNIRLAEMTAKIAQLNTDLAVMREREEQRAEKISRMWDWWIRAIEMGFLSGSKQKHDSSPDLLKEMHP